MLLTLPSVWYTSTACLPWMSSHVGYSGWFYIVSVRDKETCRASADHFSPRLFQRNSDADDGFFDEPSTMRPTLTAVATVAKQTASPKYKRTTEKNGTASLYVAHAAPCA